MTGLYFNISHPPRKIFAKARIHDATQCSRDTPCRNVRKVAQSCRNRMHPRRTTPYYAAIKGFSVLTEEFYLAVTLGETVYEIEEFSLNSGGDFADAYP